VEEKYLKIFQLDGTDALFLAIKFHYRVKVIKITIAKCTSPYIGIILKSGKMHGCKCKCENSRTQYGSFYVREYLHVICAFIQCLWIELE